VVGPVGVQSPLDRASRDAERAPACPDLDRLEVEPLERARTYERFDLGDDRGIEACLEAPFLAASPGMPPGAARSAWHNPSLTSTSSPVSLRRRWYSAICSRVFGTALGGMIRVTVLPPTPRVSDQLGPCPPPSSRAQWQFGLPQRR
jgi:hypothetical protein